jgi:hypothetical protein
MGEGTMTAPADLTDADGFIAELVAARAQIRAEFAAAVARVATWDLPEVTS